MNQCKRPYPVLAVLEEFPVPFVRHVTGLEQQEAVDDLHIIFYTVMDLPEKHLFFPERSLQLFLGFLAPGNVPRCALDTDDDTGSIVYRYGPCNEPFLLAISCDVIDVFTRFPGHEHRSDAFHVGICGIRRPDVHHRSSHEFFRWGAYESCGRLVYQYYFTFPIEIDVGGIRFLEHCAVSLLALPECILNPLPLGNVVGNTGGLYRSSVLVMDLCVDDHGHYSAVLHRDVELCRLWDRLTFESPPVPIHDLFPVFFSGQVQGGHGKEFFPRVARVFAHDIVHTYEFETHEIDLVDTGGYVLDQLTVFLLASLQSLLGPLAFRDVPDDLEA